MYPFPHRRLGVQNLTPASFQEIPRLDRIKPLHVHRRPSSPSASFHAHSLLPSPAPCTSITPLAVLKIPGSNTSRPGSTVSAPVSLYHPAPSAPYQRLTCCAPPSTYGAPNASRPGSSACDSQSRWTHARYAPSLPYEGRMRTYFLSFLPQIRDASSPPLIHATAPSASERRPTRYALSSPED